MPLVSMRQILDHAAENGYGVPAFNINDIPKCTNAITDNISCFSFELFSV